jgi:hypothetical protein
MITTTCLIFSRASDKPRADVGAVVVEGAVVAGAGLAEGVAAGDEHVAIVKRTATQAAGRTEPVACTIGRL